MILLCLHLYLNYAAVRAVCMRTLNRQRVNIVFSHLLDTGEILGPREVSSRERVFERDGALRWNQSVIGLGLIGVDSSAVLRFVAQEHHGTKSLRDFDIDILEWKNVFKDCGYLLWFDLKTQSALMLLKLGASARDQLEAWVHGLVMAKQVHESSSNPSHAADIVGGLRSTRTAVKEIFAKHAAALESAGWNLQGSTLETRGGIRVELTDDSDGIFKSKEK